MTLMSECSKVSEGALEAKPGSESGYSQQGGVTREIPGRGTGWTQITATRAFIPSQRGGNRKTNEECDKGRKGKSSTR